MTALSIHQGQPALAYGAALSEAQAVVILLHGRGSTAQSILSLAGQLPQESVAYLAPQAALNTWYPHSGFIPLEANEPYVSSAFQVLAGLLDQLAETGIAARHVVIGGFSQGACLAAEFTARHPQRLGGLFVLSGALMGPPDSPRDYPGALDGTPVYIGGSDRDSWVTESQMRQTAQVLQGMGGAVEIAIQPGAEHTIRPADIAQVRRMIAGSLP